MGWNPEKWVKFTSPYLNQPSPTEPPSDKYKEEVKEEAAAHEERIDLDALGRQRMKELLEIVASETPGSQGPAGPAGVEDPDAITQLAITKTFLSGAFGQEVLRATIDAADLDGVKDMIMVGCFMRNLNNVKVKWNVGETAKTIFDYSLSGINPNDGYVEIWITQSRHPFDIGELRSFARAIGIDTDQYENTNVGSNWMAAGGDVSVELFPEDITAPWGGLVTINKFAFPKVTLE
jgi:hypothetical protein